jgi:hypothetical protein
MPRLSIYFNRTYATNAQIIGMLRANPDGRELRVVGTHADPDSPVLASCDLALLEPELTGEDYVDWALEFTASHDIDVFVPRLELAAIAGQRHRFQAQGVALLAAPAAAVRLFADKAATYADAAGLGLAVPPYRVVSEGTELLAAYAEIRELTGSACLKPVTGVGADGFRILTDQPLTLDDVLGPLPPTVHVRAVAEAIDAARTAGTRVPPLLVLPFLTGPEISVDVLGGIDGSTLAAIGRAKYGRRRVIVDDPGARAVAETLTAEHRLAYLSNIQVRYWQGPADDRPLPYLLEVNTRISGGLFQTSLAGVNLPWAAVRLALGQDPQVGEANYDISFDTPMALAVVPGGAQASGAEPANGTERATVLGTG